jgi:hypothetical protein
VCLVAMFPMNECKLYLDNVCDGYNVLSDYKFAVKLNIMSVP